MICDTIFQIACSQHSAAESIYILLPRSYHVVQGSCICIRTRPGWLCAAAPMNSRQTVFFVQSVLIVAPDAGKGSPAQWHGMQLLVICLLNSALDPQVACRKLQ